MSTSADYRLPWTGSCRCGQFKYEITSAAKFVFACHCTDCQQLSASAFSIGMLIDSEGFRTTEGTLQEWAKTADSGVISRQSVCPTCATWIRTDKDDSPDTIILRPMSLDDHRWVRPIAQIFTDSALPWALMSTAFSLPGNVEGAEQIMTAFAASDIRPG